MYLERDKEVYFPRLRQGEYRVTSEPTPRYNCIAHAIGKDDAWWWPEGQPQAYWPIEQNEESIETFVQAYSKFGYTVCDSRDLEPGFDKIAIYADESSYPTHAARQTPEGRWTSKLGEWEDIEHDRLEALEGLAGKSPGYGSVSVVLRRESSQAEH